jgi:WD repeat-containing protein 1 (actin-interacting protein 1)
LKAIVLGDIETQKLTTEWTLGSGVDHQQVGNTWAGPENIVSLSMSGTINIFDRRQGAKPSRFLFVRLGIAQSGSCD